MSLPLGDYARKIMEIFAEAYPGSGHEKGGRKVRKGNWESSFPEISAEVTAKEDFLRGVEALIERGIVSVKWKRFREGDDVEALYLEDPQSLYRMTDLPDPRQVREEMISAAFSWRPKNAEGEAVREAVLARLEAYHDVYFTGPESLRNAFILFDTDPVTTAHRSLRNLSIHLYRDSKRLEAILKNADRLYSGVWGRGISEVLDLNRSYPEASFFLDGSLLVDREGSSRQWDVNGLPVSLPETTIDRIREVIPAQRPGRVLAVENKETFYCAFPLLRERFGCFVYTGGYPNGAVSKFITLLSRNDFSLHHFGDLDPEGVAIFLDVEKQFGAAIEPFLMNADVYREYARYGYPLGGPAKAKLDRLDDERFSPLIAAIKQAGIGVEQEVIDLSAVKKRGKDEENCHAE